MNEPINWMRKHYKKYGNFRVAAEFSKGYWKYFIYKSRYFFDFWNSLNGFQPNHRDVFKDEIVIEGDLPKRLDNYRNSVKIEKMMNDKGISYLKFYSGNKSYHIHSYWPELNNVEGHRRAYLKKKIISWMLGCEVSCKHADCNIKKFDVDFQLTGNHLVRMEYGLHNKTGRRKILLKTVDNGKNFIPQEVKEDYEKFNNRMKRWQPIDSNIKADMNCMKYFTSEDTGDCRKRILFFIINRLIGQGKSSKEVTDVVFNWNINVLFTYFTTEVLLRHIHTAFDKPKPEYNVGCPYARSLLEQLGKLVVCKGCPYNEAKRKLNEQKKD